MWNIILNFISEFRQRLIWWAVVLIIILFLIYFVSIAKQQINWIDDIYGRERLIKELWRKDIKYPIIWFEWDYYEPTQVLSRGGIDNDDGSFWSDISWLWYIDFTYIIDADLKKYNISTIKMKDLWATNRMISNLTLKKVEKSYDIVNFKEIKEQIIKRIEEDPEGSAYVWLEKEIEQTTNIKELAEVMDEWTQ